MKSSLIPVFMAILLIATGTKAESVRTVVGKIILPPEIASSQRILGPVHLITLIDDPEITYPDNYITWTPGQRHAWYLDYLQTDAGKAYKSALDKAQASKHSYILDIDKDGFFRTENVSPGLYKITTVANLLDGSHYIATSTDLTIPGDPASSPCDLGQVKLGAAKILEVGDTAPDFTILTLDAKQLRLSDYKGKFIFLNYWASWCGPCMAEIPALKRTRDAFANDDRFVMINLCLDESPNRAKHVVEKNRLTWPQGFLGDWSKSNVRESYGVQKIPANFLIGSDGKILSKDLAAPEIQPAVAAVLTK